MQADSPMNVKQIIVARRDLKMSPGKLAAQVAHASMGAVFQYKFVVELGASSDRELRIPLYRYPDIDHWLNFSDFTKIVLGVDSEQELIELYNKLWAYEPVLITDNGKTEFVGAKTVTCFGLPPMDATITKELTGHLKLY